MAIRRRLVWASLAVTVIAAAVTVTVVIVTAPSTGTATTATASAGSIPPAVVASIEQGLPSQDPAVVAAVLAPAVRAAYLRNPAPLLPAKSLLRLDQAHAEHTDADLERVPARVTGPTPGNWVIIVVRQDGQWTVLGTATAS